MKTPLIATDLDRTLFPNGHHPDDGSMQQLRQMVEANDFPLAFVTGRNIDQILQGIEEYHPPIPHYAIAEVGTRVYLKENTPDGSLSYKEDLDFVEFIREATPSWDIEGFKAALGKIPELRLQEDFNQNDFKLSYYADENDHPREVVHAVREAIAGVCPESDLVYSFDEVSRTGLLDVLPKRANKMEGIEFLCRKLGLRKEDVIYCGDSGNDLIPLTHGYRSILVRNAIEEVRQDVKERATEMGTLGSIYFATGNDSLNGYYASGIIEGLAHFEVAQIPS